MPTTFNPVWSYETEETKKVSHTKAVYDVYGENVCDLKRFLAPDEEFTDFRPPVFGESYLGPSTMPVLRAYDIFSPAAPRLIVGKKPIPPPPPAPKPERITFEKVGNTSWIYSGDYYTEDSQRLLKHAKGTSHGGFTLWRKIEES